MKKGHEKSDFGIVAVKPMNKAGRPVAESVEPRPGTKGNAEQRNMHRTQGRQRMSQSLDRVRKAFASPSNTRGRSHVRESRPRGSVRGALSNGRPYRDTRQPIESIVDASRCLGKRFD